MLNNDMHSNSDSRTMSPFMVAMVGMFIPDQPDSPEDSIDWEGLM